MQTMSAEDAKHQFGRLIDTARSEPVVLEKHGWPVVVIVSVEEFKRLREGQSDRTHGPPFSSTSAAD
jgi:prevent-host-death family protein